MEFDKQKSHLSDLKKIEFEANTTSNSPIAEIPGIGEKTTQQMQEKKRSEDPRIVASPPGVGNQ